MLLLRLPLLLSTPYSPLPTPYSPIKIIDSTVDLSEKFELPTVAYPDVP